MNLVGIKRGLGRMNGWVGYWLDVLVKCGWDGVGRMYGWVG